jgi:hypothetical protein
MTRAQPMFSTTPRLTVSSHQPSERSCEGWTPSRRAVLAPCMRFFSKQPQSKQQSVLLSTGKAVTIPHSSAGYSADGDDDDARAVAEVSTAMDVCDEPEAASVRGALFDAVDLWWGRTRGKQQQSFTHFTNSSSHRSNAPPACTPFSQWTLWEYLVSLQGLDPYRRIHPSF